MITIENIKEWSKSNETKGKQTLIKTPKVLISIVGGRSGLYGDFEKDFEVAILSPSGSFITKLFWPNLNDDVIPYLESEKLVELVNSLTTRGFQVL